jgi:DNA mismatch repair ATPase MutS
LELPGIAGLSQRLKIHSDATASIPRASSQIVPERSGLFDIASLLQEYVTILFLSEVRAFHRVLAKIKVHRNELSQLFDTLGELDALQAIASFRSGLPFYCKPAFDTSHCAIEVTDVFHPLIASPIANSISLVDRGCIVTGSNMSGKSTFLRTLGVAAVLAQTICTCPANSYRACHLRVLTSLSTRDELSQGKSYYLVEADRLLMMIRSSEGDIPTFCLIDEILRGTNTAERVVASGEILSFMAKLNAVVVAATHDLDLVEFASRTYDTYYFEASMNAADIQFDYKLRAGTTYNHTAIGLLEYLRYPDAIVENARRRLKS